MTRAPRKQAESGIYHIVARGVSRCVIFEDDADRERFLGDLGELCAEAGAKVYAWCLMENHYHLLAQLELPPLSAMMKALNSSYALYFNTRHDRVGHLFQGRFKSEPVDSDRYFLTVLRYIHQNPEKAGMAATGDYRWSSYREYLGAAGFVDTELGLSLLGGREGFLDFHATLDMTAACCDVGRSRRIVCEEDARAVAQAALGDTRLESVAGLARSERDDAICRLRAASLSVRQIERLTGVSRGVVAKVRRS